MQTNILDGLMRDERATKAVFGLGREKLDALGRDMERLWKRELEKRKGRRRKVGGGRRGQIPGGRQKAAFVLFYLKVYPKFDVLCAVSGINRGECCRWVHKLMPLLEGALGQKLMLPRRKIRSMEEFYAAFPQAREVIFDGMERPRWRPGKKSSGRKHYSGKKKRHTQKTIVGTQGRRIGYLGPSKRGARHDKRLLDQRHVTPFIPPNMSVLLDSGFQGMKHPGACIPHKATKKRPLTEEQKKWNTLLAGLRVDVEHAIGGMKRLGAVADVYRNRIPNTHDRFNVLAAGIWNYFIA
jgi:hypothetical protein